jgi:LDH2 family malate/lactate/ureidoglycolate dehydrogenase
MSAGPARVLPAALTDFLGRVYAAAGLPPDDAAACAAQTVDAELRGVVSHGCVRVGVFVERLARGTVNPTPRVTTLIDLPGWALLDGDRGMSAVGGRRAMEAALAKAATQGVAAAAVRSVSHTGHVGWFAAMALARGMIGVVASSAAANLAPWGGADRLVGNNPIAFAIPSAGEFPIVFDMATSTVARGRVLLAAKTGAPIPEGWALDADGRPTTDAERAVAGTMLPLGGHKGAGLALVLGLLTNALTASPPESAQPDWLETGRDFSLALFCLVIDPRQCLGADYAALVRDAVAGLKTSRLAPGFDEIRVPGEAAARRLREHAARGIALPPALVRELDEIGARLGVGPLGVG